MRERKDGPGLDENNPPTNPEQPTIKLQAEQKYPSNEVRKIHGVLRVVPTSMPVLPESSPRERMQLAAPPLDQQFCAQCGGGNPPSASTCMWCGWSFDQPPLPDRPPSRTLFEAYKAALFHSSAEGFASEVPNASWKRIWIGSAIGSAVALLAVLLATILLSYHTLLTTWRGASSAASGSAQGTSLPDFLILPLAVLLFFLIGAAIFLLNALFLYWLCRRFGGVGRTGRFRTDFMVHAYLLSLVNVPVSTAGYLFTLVPVAGSCAWLLLSLYAIRLDYFAIRASMQLSRSKAQGVIIAEIVLSFILVIGLIGIAIFVALLSAFSSL